VLVGADVRGARVVIIDDVLTAGTALRQSHELLVAAGATPVLAITALDRQEVGANGRSAVAELVERTGLPVTSLVTVQDLLGYLQGQGGRADTVSAIADYQRRYGIA